MFIIGISLLNFKNLIKQIVFSVVLLTGGFRVKGHSGFHVKSTSIYNPVTKKICSLPKLPEGRWEHSQDGGLACGGTNTNSLQTTCVKWSSGTGTWNHSHTLKERRVGHVSWATASGVYLIGGDISSGSSEKVNLDGSVEEGFSLKYETRLTPHLMM